MQSDPVAFSGGRGKTGFRTLLVLFGCVGLAGCVVALAWSCWAEKALGLFWPRIVHSGWRSDHTLDLPGITQPPTLPAAKAGLKDNAQVIGVSSGGRHRAYLVAALQGGPPSHIINDLLGGVPISVTRCDISHCTRVFTGQLSKVLNLSVGGMKANKLVLKVGNHRYLQESTRPLDAGAPIFPYPSHPWEWTTWGRWRREHPGTDIYVGASLPERGAQPPSK